MKFKFLFLVLILAFLGANTLKAQDKTQKKEEVKIEKTTSELCDKRGEIKESEKCCKPEGRIKCEKCGLFKGSPGCCKMAKTEKKDEVTASKCGEAKKTGCCDKPKKN